MFEARNYYILFATAVRIAKRAFPSDKRTLVAPLLGECNVMTKRKEAEEQLSQHIRSYLRGEMRTALLLLFWGVVAFSIGAWCWSTQPDLLYQGLSFPLMVFAAIHLAMGLMQLVQTRKRAPKLLTESLPERATLMEEILRLDIQLPRMNFYRKTSLVIVLIGLALMLAGSLGGFGRYMTGTGSGLILQAAVTLAIDLFSGLRAGLFHHELRKFL